jgi:hypothetical protein
MHKAVFVKSRTFKGIHFMSDGQQTTSSGRLNFLIGWEVFFILVLYFNFRSGFEIDSIDWSEMVIPVLIFTWAIFRKLKAKWNSDEI